MRVSLENLIPGTGKINGIFRAVVEDINDKTKRGRVRVRIFGLHTQIIESGQSQGVPTEHLPWAEPAGSILEGSISGLGVWTVPVQGSHVFVFFENGNINQPRYFASSPGGPIPERPNKKTGFSDPDEVYPLEDWAKEPDFHRLARDDSKKTYVEEIKKNLLKQGEIEEPDPFYTDAPDEKYPNNLVVATRGGHIIEMDSTEDGKRFTYYHPSNTYLQINNEGDMIFRNKGDRYMITMGDDLYEYINKNKTTIIGKQDDKGADNTTIFGDQELLVMGDQTYYVEGTQNILCAGENTQNISARVKQNISSNMTQSITSKLKQDVSTTGNQTISFKGNQSIQGWGNSSRSVKGRMSDSVIGMYQNTFMSLFLKNTMGMESEMSAAPKYIGSTTATFIGKSPMQAASQTASSTVDGVTGAIRESLQPLYDIVAKVQSEVGEVLGNALSEVNSVLTPITDVVNDVNNLVSYVKTEYQYAQQLVTTVQNAPQEVISAVVNKVQTIAAIPGMLIGDTLNKVTGTVGEISLLKSLNSLYSNINDTGFALSSNLDRITNLTDYMGQYGSVIDLDRYSSMNSSSPLDYNDYLDMYYPNGADLSSYPRSGLASYDGVNYDRKYFDGSETLPIAGVAGSENLAAEMYEMDQFVTDALSASFISQTPIIYNTTLPLSGIWLMEDTLEYLRSGQAAYFENILTDDFTVNEVLEPSTLSLPSLGTIIDVDVLELSTSGYLISDEIVEAIEDANSAILVPYEADLVVYNADLVLYADDIAIYETNYQAWEDGGSFGDPPEAPPGIDEPVEPETFSLDISINALLSALSAYEYSYTSYTGYTGYPGFSEYDEYPVAEEEYPVVEEEADGEYQSYIDDAIAILNDAKNTQIPSYVTAITQLVKSQLAQIMAALIYMEEVEFKDITKDIDYDKIEWAGKFDDWPPGDVEYASTWPPTPIDNENITEY
jgi:hypothetical protein